MLLCVESKAKPFLSETDHLFDVLGVRDSVYINLALALYLIINGMCGLVNKIGTFLIFPCFSCPHLFTKATLPSGAVYLKCIPGTYFNKIIHPNVNFMAF